MIAPAIYTIRHYRLSEEPDNSYVYREIDRYDDMLRMTIEVGINQGGVIEAAFEAGHRIGDRLTGVLAAKTDYFEVWSDVLDGTHDQPLHGFFYTDHTDPRISPELTLTLWGMEETQWHLLSRIVAYRSSSAGGGTLLDIEASDAMRALVRRNMTQDDPPYTDERIVNGQMIGATVSVLEDGPKSDTIGDHDVYLDDLFAAIQKIALAAKLCFRLVRDPAPAPDAISANWEFRVYGTLENDLSGEVVFSLSNGNMGQPQLVTRRAEYANVAVVGGKGEGAGRIFVVVYSEDYDSISHREIFVSARTAHTDPSLQVQGRQALEERRARREVRFTPLQTRECRYARHYKIGYVVGVVFAGVRERHRVVTARLDWDRTRPEEWQVETERLDA